MKRIRQDIRLSEKEKQCLENISKKYGMTVTDYMKYKLFDQNSDLSDVEHIYNCPNGERYNYSIAGLSMLNYLLLESLVEKFHGEDAVKVINQSIANSKEKLERIYGYKKTKVNQNE